MACEVQLDLQVGQRHAVAPLHREVHLRAHGADVDGAHLGLLADAVAGHRALHVGHDFAHRRVVDAQDRRAIEGHAMQEFEEGALELAEVVPVGFHVVGVDVGHHRHHRHQVQERCIGLVGLDHDVVAAAELGVGAGAVQAPADDESGVQPALGQHAGHQAGGGRLAVRAGDRDALLQAHQLGQHHRARHDGNLALARGEHLGVVGLHRRGRDHRVGAGDVAVRVAHVGLDAQPLQTAQRRAVGQVRAGDLVALVAQHLGDAGHAGAADADEMNVLDGVFHRLPGQALRKPRPLRPWRWFFACPWPTSARRINSGRSVCWIRSASHCGREIALLHQPAAAGIDQESGVGGLVVIHGEGNGTNTAAAPTAAISVTVLAPARQTIRSASRKGLRRVVDEGREFGLHTGGRIVGTQLVDLLGAALVKHRGPLFRPGSAPAPSARFR